MMIAGKPIDFAQRYEALAEFVARRYGNDLLLPGCSADLIGALIGGVYAETLEDIECNPHEWRARVNAYLMALA